MMPELKKLRLPELDQYRRQGLPAGQAAGNSPPASTIRRASCCPTGIARPATSAGMPMPPNKRAGEPAAPRKKGPRNLVYVMRFALPEPGKLFSITTFDPDDFIRIEVDKASVPAGCKLARASELQGRVRPRLSGLCRYGDMPASVKSRKAAILRSPFLWVGVLLLLALIGALVFSDGVAELARFSADYQRRIQQIAVDVAARHPVRFGIAGAVDPGHRLLRLWRRPHAGTRPWQGGGGGLLPRQHAGRAPGSKASSPEAGSPSPTRWRRCCWPAR